MSESPPLYAVAAEFADADALLAAIRTLGPYRFGRLEGYSPVPVPGLVEMLGGSGPVRVQWIGGVAGALGVVGAFGMMAYATVFGYRFLIRGMPLLSWPSYVVPSVSLGALLGVLAATLGMLLLDRLPRLNHPVFNIEGFARALSDRYMLTVEAREDFDVDGVLDAFERLGRPPSHVQLVPR